MPKVAILIAQHPAINHAVILREVLELRRYLDVHTASIRSPDRPFEKLSPEEKEETNRTYYVKPQGLPGAVAAHLTSSFLRFPSYLAGLWLALRLGPRLIHQIGYFTQALILGQWMRKNRIPHLHVHYSSTVGLLVKKVFPIELSISFHGPDEFDDPKGFRIREKVAACTFVRAISMYARSQLMKSSDHADWAKIQVVYMGVDPARFSPRPYRPNPDPLELICVGRLAPVKAQHILIAAVGRLVQQGRPVLLHIVGGGPSRASLEAAAAARGAANHIIFHGFTPQDKLDALYRQADAFVLASFAEGVPGVLMEAMAMEIPCVSTWIAGVPELIQNGIGGLLCAPSDETAFADAIARLIDEPGLRHRIGQAARQQILSRFNLPENAKRLSSFLRITPN